MAMTSTCRLAGMPGRFVTFYYLTRYMDNMVRVLLLLVHPRVFHPWASLLPSLLVGSYIIYLGWVKIIRELGFYNIKDGLNGVWELSGLYFTLFQFYFSFATFVVDFFVARMSGWNNDMTAPHLTRRHFPIYARNYITSLEPNYLGNIPNLDEKPIKAGHRQNSHYRCQSCPEGEAAR